MFAASSVASALSYLLHVSMSRMLGPADYGVFAALLGLYTIAFTPQSIVAVVAAKYVAHLAASGRSDRIGAFLMGMLKWVALLAVIVSIGLALGSPYLASYLQLPSAVPVLFVAAILLVGAFGPVGNGVLQGMQRFGYLAVVTVAAAISRLLSSVALVYLGLGVVGALAGSILAGIVALAITAIPLVGLIGSKQAAHPLPGAGLGAREVFGYSWLVLLASACFTILTSVDLIIVKHYFSPVDAGHYAAASVLAKVILFFAGPVATVMFPKAARRHSLGQDSSNVARASFVVVGLLSGLLVLVYLLFTPLLVRLMFGAGYEAVNPLVVGFGVAMLLYTLVNVMLLYYLSVGEARFVYILIGGTILQLMLLVLFHDTLPSVIAMLILNASLVLVFGELVCRGLTSHRFGSSASLLSQPVLDARTID